MSKQQAPNLDSHGAFERQDLSPAGLIYFMIGLAVFVVAIYFVVYGMYNFLDNYDKANQVPMSPMLAPRADTRAVTPPEIQAFPEPRLEESERNQLRQYIEDQDRKLATYNWVDKDKGVVQIPIDRAMELIVARGLPVRQETAQTKSQTPMQNSNPASTDPKQKDPQQEDQQQKKKAGSSAQ
jgi:hypothetical protein